MSTAAATSPSWSRARWTLAIVGVFAAHIGLIFAFGTRLHPSPVQTPVASTLRFTTEFGDWYELNDPGLFAKPNPRGFAGETWMKWPSIALPSFQWSERPRWLVLDDSSLGMELAQHREKNPLVEPAYAILPRPEVDAIGFGLGDLARRSKSSVRAGGALASRRMIDVPAPGPVPAADLLTNSVVQVLVDGAGYVYSWSLLAPGSGSAIADARALELAAQARFEPLTNNPAPAFGALIFEWQTELPLENGGANPSPKIP